MARLCERPGCFAPATVAYGMEHENLLVWLAPPPAGAPADHGLICRRHADAMVVPRGWVLDDRRDERPRLFKVVDPTATVEPKRTPRQRSAAVAAPPTPPLPPPQLVFDDVDPDPQELIESITVGEIHPLGEPDPEETRALPWRPVFDEDDDLNGLLAAKGPLLSRAFRSAGVRTGND